MVSIEYSSSINHPIETVSAWHGRPGAFQRLAPPWQPAAPRRGSGVFADGNSVIRLPGGSAGLRNTVTTTHRTASPTTSSLSHCRGTTSTRLRQTAQPARTLPTQSRRQFPLRSFGRCSHTGTPSYATISTYSPISRAVIQHNEPSR